MGRLQNEAEDSAESAEGGLHSALNRSVTELTAEREQRLQWESEARRLQEEAAELRRLQGEAAEGAGRWQEEVAKERASR